VTKLDLTTVTTLSNGKVDHLDHVYPVGLDDKVELDDYDSSVNHVHLGVRANMLVTSSIMSVRLVEITMFRSKTILNLMAETMMLTSATAPPS
jgi:hypothetical protein